LKYKKILPLKDFNKISLKLPSSKSLTQRALICSSLATGNSKIINPLISEDTLLLKSALSKLGTNFKDIEKGWEVEGIFPPKLEKEKIYLGNNGTGARFFLALSCLGKGDYIEIYGKPRLHERPMAPLISALRELSAKIECQEKEGFFPVKVIASELKSKKVNLPGNVSSQFISALLLIAPYLPKGIELEIQGEFLSQAYVNLTVETMKAFGAKIEIDDKKYKVYPGSYIPTVYEVEADASSASYFLAIPLILGKGEIIIENYNINSYQGDTKFLEFIKKMGAEVEAFSPIGVKVKFSGIPQSQEFDLKDTPDLFPTMCILGAVANGKTVLKGAPHLRFKETDRIKAMATELEKLGVKTKELPDGLIIEGTDRFKEAEIETYDDHRIAMSFAILGLKTGGIIIKNPDCVKKSFPNFWEYLEKLYE